MPSPAQNRSGFSARPKQFLFAVAAIAIAALVLVQWNSVDEANADHIPQRVDEITYQMEFNTTRPDMFGPGGAVPLPRSVEVLDFDWNEGLTIDGTTSFNGSFDFFGERISLPTATFGADLTAQVDGNVNVGVKMEGFDQAGTVEINYPIEITLEVPKRDTFRRGETITIGSHFRFLPGAGLFTESPTGGSVSAIASLQAALEMGLDLCLIDCTSSLSYSVPEIPLPPIEVPVPCGDGANIEVTVPMPSINLFSLGSLGIQAKIELQEGGNFFKVVDLADSVAVSPAEVSARLVDAVERARRG
jgi:hypothetical protein